MQPCAISNAFRHRGQGHTWTRPTPIHGAGSCRPKLLLLPSGPLVLSGGRMGNETNPTANPTDPGNSDQLLWISVDGKGRQWSRHSISGAHNRQEPNPALHFPPSVNTTTWDSTVTNDYSSLVPTGDDSFIYIYQLRSECHARSGYLHPVSDRLFLPTDASTFPPPGPPTPPPTDPSKQCNANTMQNCPVCRVFAMEITLGGSAPSGRRALAAAEAPQRTPSASASTGASTGTSTSSSVKLSNGLMMPKIGLGTAYFNDSSSECSNGCSSHVFQHGR